MIRHYAIQPHGEKQLIISTTQFAQPQTEYATEMVRVIDSIDWRSLRGIGEGLRFDCVLDTKPASPVYFADSVGAAATISSQGDFFVPVTEIGGQNWEDKVVTLCGVVTRAIRNKLGTDPMFSLERLQADQPRLIPRYSGDIEYNENGMPVPEIQPVGIITDDYGQTTERTGARTETPRSTPILKPTG